MPDLSAILHRPPPSRWQTFLNQPILYIARTLYTHAPTPASTPTNPVSIVCISDTHNSQPPLPYGDILIHAGDLTASGSREELQAALCWLRAQPHRTKIVIAGNHDILLDRRYDTRPHYDARLGERDLDRFRLVWGDIIYLQDSETEVVCANGRRLRIWGSPYTPKNGNWAFQYPRGENLWAGKMPVGVDVLVTHGPPMGFLDMGAGCGGLLREVCRVKPRLHVFGHMHSGAGQDWIRWGKLQIAFEKVIVEKGGFWNLMGVVREFCWSWWRGDREGTLLVNAAVAEGLRDQVRREAVKVVI